MKGVGRISFPICLAVFVAGWFSGCMFILVTLDPQRVPELLSPLNSKFGVGMQERPQGHVTRLSHPTDPAQGQPIQATAMQSQLERARVRDSAPSEQGDGSEYEAKAHVEEDDGVSAAAKGRGVVVPSSLTSVKVETLSKAESDNTYESNKLTTFPGLTNAAGDPGNRWIMVFTLHLAFLSLPGRHLNRPRLHLPSSSVNPA